MIGAAIVDHLWQSTACVALAWLVTLALRRNRAAVRHSIWLAASLKFLLPFSLLASLGSTLDLGLASDEGILPATQRVVVNWSGPLLTPGSSAMNRNAERGTSVQAALFVVWGAGLAGILIYRITRGLRLREFERQARRLWTGREIEALKRVAAGANVSLASSPSTIEPGVHGIVDPVLLLPAGIADRLTDAQLESIMAHEMAHIRRRDNLSATIHAVVEAVFWFHPAVWWVGTRLLDERERACDQDVLTNRADPEAYAGAILAVCEFYLSAPAACVAGITGSNLKERIEAIMLNTKAARLSLSRRLLLVATGALAVLIPIVLGAVQKPGTPAGPARLAFDVASIRLNPNQNGPEGIPPPPPSEGAAGGGPGPNSDPEMGPPVVRFFPGGRMVAKSASLKGIIRDAYPGRPGWRLDPWRVSGGPEWVKSAKYDIEAVSEKAKPEQMVAMLQTLLADRFKLKVHWETQQLPIYELTRAKSGLKVEEWKAGSCFDYRSSGGAYEPPAPPPPPPPPPGGGDRVSFAPTRRNANQPCGIYMQLLGASTQFFSLKATMTELVPVLEFVMRRTVSDKTDYKRTFNVDMVYEDPAFSAALEEQAGLKLQSTKGPVSVLVIDSVQRPTEN